MGRKLQQWPVFRTFFKAVCKGEGLGKKVITAPNIIKGKRW
ncbi:MAG: hypothetical protein Q4C17_04080 [Bacillota bacterium]|nr:hypothetical protein [Bacillota bacterium]